VEKDWKTFRYQSKSVQTALHVQRSIQEEAFPAHGEAAGLGLGFSSTSTYPSRRRSSTGSSASPPTPNPNPNPTNLHKLRDPPKPPRVAKDGDDLPAATLGLEELAALISPSSPKGESVSQAQAATVVGVTGLIVDTDA
jgi:hypothetical protein